jgi:hypothetical protein
MVYIKIDIIASQVSNQNAEVKSSPKLCSLRGFCACSTLAASCPQALLPFAFLLLPSPQPASIVHRLLKGLAIGFVENAVGASEHFGTLLLRARAEAVNVAGNFDLLAQRQILDTSDDGFDDSHPANN